MSSAIRKGVPFCLCLLLWVLIAAFDSSAAERNVTTLEGKHIVGYQGWFSCPGDTSGLGWGHWFRSASPSASSLAIDMWPDTSGFDQDELCPTPLRLPSGAPANLFSSENPKTVARHFKWLRDYGIDAVALQRFESGMTKPAVMIRANNVLRNVQGAATATGRGFFIMYDLTGADSDVVERLEEDWIRLTRDAKITDSPAYVQHNGKPVVALWGIGFADRAITISQSQNLLKFFKANATVIGGVPAYWRTLDKDSRREAGWAEIYRSFDIISPWTVGRFLNRREADDFINNVMSRDIAEVKRYGVEYMPVIFPGYSRYNAANGKEIAFNRILRDCGNFYSHLAHAEIKTGATMLYTAMFDEVNEGTAIFKVAAVENEIPVGAKLVKLGDNNCPEANDSYLKRAGSITKLLRAYAPQLGK